jgi:hypothetical protein
MNYEEKQALDEGHYWFAVQSIAEYVQLHGYMKVTKDIFSVIEDAKASRRVTLQDMADVPF